jgi:sulfate permease, SulP family
LDALISALRATGVTFHLADVKASVLERLSKVGFLQRLRPGEVFPSANDAVKRLAGAALWNTEIVF